MVKREIVEIINRYINIIKNNNFKVRDVYLFGSYTKDSYNNDSDIDIAIVLDNVHDLFDTQVELMKLRRLVDTRIEPHPYRSKDFKKDNPFVEEIIRTGQKIA